MFSYAGTSKKLGKMFSISREDIARPLTFTLPQGQNKTKQNKNLSAEAYHYLDTKSSIFDIKPS